MSSTPATDAFKLNVARIQTKPQYRKPIAWGLTLETVSTVGRREVVDDVFYAVNAREHLGSYTVLWDLLGQPSSTQAEMLCIPVSAQCLIAAAEKLAGVVAESPEKEHRNHQAFTELGELVEPDKPEGKVHLFAIFEESVITRRFTRRVSGLSDLFMTPLENERS